MRMMFRRAWLSILASMFAVIVGCFVPSSMFAYADTPYVVQKGDTLWHIAEGHHVSVNALMRNNRLASDVIQVHQKLLIPTHRENFYSQARKPTKNHDHKTPFVVFHTVQTGDTLWQIALNNRTSVTRLIAMNHLQSDTLFPGQRIRVYVGSKSKWRKQEYRRYSKRGLPVQLLSVYQAAGRRFGIPWTVLAAIHHEETNYSTSGDEVSPSGAIGPMQFMPSTFERYAVLAPGQLGLPDIHNVCDAIYTCAHMLAADGFQKNPSMALYLYNHSMQYVESVQHYADSV